MEWIQSVVMPLFTSWEGLGVWLGAFLTIAVFSFLYKDNPVYKWAEHLFVGVSAAFFIVASVEQTIVPAIRDALAFPGWFKLITWLAVALGLLILFKLELLATTMPNLTFLSRYPIAFVTGIGVGLGIVNIVHGYFFPQTQATFLPLFNIKGADWLTLLNNWIIVLAVIFSLMYFYFSAQYKGKSGFVLRVGITFLMVAFGAMFGYTVMARVSLLIGRIFYLIHNWLHIV